MKNSHPRVSLVITVKNEEDTISELLDTVLAQSYVPDEIVIVDGGSTDKTVTVIRNYTKSGAPINLVVAPGTNIAQGRNLAIKNAMGEIIACTDAGMRLQRDWLKNLISRFDNKTDIVLGVYHPYELGSFLQRCVGETFFPKERFDKETESSSVPSAKSMALRKTAWEKVGGYPEFLETAEDTVFGMQLHEAGFRFKLAKDAIVYWRVCEGLRDLFRKVFRYSKNDVKAQILSATWKPNVRRLAIFGSFLLLLSSSFLFWWGLPLLAFFLVGLCAVLTYQGFIVARRMNDYRAVLMVPIIVFCVDFGRLQGLIYGLMRYKLLKFDESL
jgi:glycosyltransferase involved in cell wall biosynthesis